MDNDIRSIINNKDHSGLRAYLEKDKSYANEGVPLCDDGTRKAHPLHRICDAVFAKRITDNEAIEIAKIFLEFGANINGNQAKDSPLLAAASLHAEQLGIFYIDNGANISIMGSDGETALHWAAYCGRDRLTEKLIKTGANIDLKDTHYNGTPIDWAAHTLMNNDEFNTHQQMACIKLLLQNGANKSALSEDTTEYLKKLATNDPELKTLI